MERDSSTRYTRVFQATYGCNVCQGSAPRRNETGQKSLGLGQSRVVGNCRCVPWCREFRMYFDNNPETFGGPEGIGCEAGQGTETRQIAVAGQTQQARSAAS